MSISRPALRLAMVLLVVSIHAAVRADDDPPLLTKDQIVASWSGMELWEAAAIGSWNEAPRPPWFLTFHRSPWQSDAYASSVALYRAEGDGYRLVRRWTPHNDEGVGPYITRPVTFTHAHELFLHIPMRYPGTGAHRADEIIHLGRDGGVTPVDFEPAAAGYARLAREGAAVLNPGEGVWKGEHYRFTDDALHFRFYLWNQGDGNCCPTAGCVEGTMAITRIDDGHNPLRFRMGIDTFTRRDVDDHDR